MLKFEYCECGCKCYTAQMKGLCYSIFLELDSKKLQPFHVFTHNRRVLIGRASTFEEAKEIAQKNYDEHE